jgi:hypothetical protein
MRRKELVITDRLPAYFLFDYAILGNFALTTGKQRFILDEYATTYNGEVDTPGHHFSTVCKDILFPRNKVYHDNLSYPYKAIPGKHPYCFYLDIVHAFSQIATVFGMDCSHREGRYMGFGTTPLPHIFEDSKIMRALLVSGTGKESTLTEWRNHELKTRKFPNRNHAPMLQRAIFAFLHAVACKLSPYTIYHHTDGFIVPYIHLARVSNWLDKRGILYSVKGEGVTEVYGIGSYRIGELRTRHQLIQQRSSNGVRADSAEWWLGQWERGKAYRG